MNGERECLWRQQREWLYRKTNGDMLIVNALTCAPDAASAAPPGPRPPDPPRPPQPPDPRVRDVLKAVKRRPVKSGCRVIPLRRPETARSQNRCVAARMTTWTHSSSTTAAA